MSTRESKDRDAAAETLALDLLEGESSTLDSSARRLAEAVISVTRKAGKPVFETDGERVTLGLPELWGLLSAAASAGFILGAKKAFGHGHSDAAAVPEEQG